MHIGIDGEPRNLLQFKRLGHSVSDGRPQGRELKQIQTRRASGATPAEALTPAGAFLFGIIEGKCKGVCYEYD